ncbi:MAG: ABC transporter permease [Nitriliruptorales bacterium]|nr:ABC transporter permease [Nitriliruptorales bacterium]
MFLASLRDLQWRHRRFLVSVGAASLILGVSLIMSGLADSLRSEAEITVEAVGADHWVVGAGVSGPFSSVSALPAETASTFDALPGVDAADPLIVLHQAVTDAEERQVDVVLFGHEIGGLGSPPVVEGRVVTGPGEAVIDAQAGIGIGETVTAGAAEFTIVGRTRDLTTLAGLPSLYAPIGEVQGALLGGLDVAQAIVVRGTPDSLPSELAALTPVEVVDDMLRPLSAMIGTVQRVRDVLWLAAAAIVGSILYLAALERGRDFAVFRAMGFGPARLFASLAIQSIVISALAGVLGIGLAQVLVPLLPSRLSVPTSALAMLPLVVIAVGIIASAVTARRAATTDPALAFGGAA